MMESEAGAAMVLPLTSRRVTKTERAPATVVGKVTLRASVGDVDSDGETATNAVQPVAANPDGSIYAWRIVDPRKFIFTVGFDL